MAFNRSLASKAPREDAHLEMAAPVPRSRVPHVAVTIVHDVELEGFERCLKSTSN